MVPEGRWVGGPFMDVILEWVTMESQEISPISDLFGTNIEAGGESCGFGGVVGVSFESFFFRQPEEFSGDVDHVGYGGFRYTVILDLEEAVVAAGFADLVDDGGSIGAVEIMEID